MGKTQTYDLQHKILINQNAAKEETDENGNPKYDWQLYHTAWAAKKGLRGRLFFQAAATQNEDDVLFIIHYKDGIKAGMQLICDGVTYEIKAPPVDINDDRRWLEIHARAVLENGG